MPFTYLGLPLGTTKPLVQDFLPMVNRIEKRVMGLSKLLTYSGRLLMVNSVLSALPTFYTCTLKIPVTIIEQIDKYRKHELWDGGDINRKGTCLVSWKKACRPKDQGGLGIVNLRAHNNALLLKFLHKFYNQHDLPWVQLTWQKLYRRPTPPHLVKPKGSFWWKAVIRLADQFFSMASCIAKNGATISFWEDTWNLGVMKLQYPEFYTYALNKKISVQTFRQNDIQDLLWLPLSLTASQELNDLQENLPMIAFRARMCSRYKRPT